MLRKLSARRPSKKERARRFLSRRARFVDERRLSDEFLPKGTGANQGDETDQKQASGARLRWSPFAKSVCKLDRQTVAGLRRAGDVRLQ
jgi:hypothetical protein